MTNQDKARIKQLVRDTFWHLKYTNDSKLTPRLFRDWAFRNLDHQTIIATAINISGRGFWLRVEKLCYLHKHLRYWHKIAK